MLVILIGKTASGKSTIANILNKEYGYSNIITYTTRPPRFGEIDHISYHFITEEEFLKKIDEGFFVEYTKYKTSRGVWYYGSAYEDYLTAPEKSVVVLNPDGFRKLLKKLDRKNSLLAYVFAPKKVIKKRLLSRGDKWHEATRRMAADDKDFFGIEKEVDFIVENGENDKIEHVVASVLAEVYRRENCDE